MRPFLVTILMIALALVAFAPGVRQCTLAALDWVQQAGAWGPAALALIYVIATIGMVPGTLLTLGAGALFGLWMGVLAVVIGSNLGAIAAFVLGRTLLRGWTQAMLSRTPNLAVLDRAVAQQGFRIVLLTRLSPLFPFNLLNYAFGMTNVSLRDYVAASAVGMFPGTVLYVYIGAAAGSLAKLRSDADDSAASRLSFAIGLVVTLMLTAYLHRLAQAALARQRLIGTTATTSVDKPTQ
ncbi:MAG: TVP38/TMEM64 family protein [Planctomycetes bacterium]|nr:TVP38/TMEM64 family protein [Planctomycetota bacterium]